ncbi:MAG: hypothetical protein ACXAEN_26185 [Candidatus Thorarchaeota archaeon]|jgi:NTP pyrophosphatase (non-canonical NTP hydrolase)
MGKYNADMTIKEMTIQCLEDSERWFPGQVNEDLVHHTLSMCGEVGEVANLVKKLDRGSIVLDSDEARARFAQSMASELADVFTYMLNVAGLIGVDMALAYQDKREYNESRFGTIRAVE